MFDIVPLPYLLVNLSPRPTPFSREATASDSPALPLAPLFPSLGYTAFNPKLLQATRIDYRPPRSYKMQWNLNVQRQLTRTMALTVGYVGSVGVKLAHTIYDHNQTPYERGRFNGTNWTFPVPASGSVADVPVVNTNFAQIRTTDFAGHLSYHSLQANFTQRPVKGLMYQIAYTWGKAIDKDRKSTRLNSSHT